MPARGRQAAAAAGAAPANAGHEEEQLLSRMKLPNLNTENFDHWERVLKHVLYAREAEELYNFSLQPAVAPNAGARAVPPRAPNVPANERRRAWGLICSSLSQDMLLEVDAVGLGEVEALLYRIREHYYRTTTHTKARLKKQLLKLQMEDFGDIDTYIASTVSLCQRLAGMGAPVSDEDRIFHLLEGLPHDYAPVKAQIRMPRPGIPDLSWDDIVTQLKDFADASQEQSGLSAATRLGKAGNRTHMALSLEERTPAKAHWRMLKRRDGRCHFLKAPPKPDKGMRLDYRAMDKKLNLCRQYKFRECTRANCKQVHDKDKRYCLKCKVEGHNKFSAECPHNTPRRPPAAPRKVGRFNVVKRDRSHLTHEYLDDHDFSFALVEERSQLTSSPKQPPKHLHKKTAEEVQTAELHHDEVPCCEDVAMQTEAKFSAKEHLAFTRAVWAARAVLWIKVRFYLDSGASCHVIADSSYCASVAPRTIRLTLGASKQVVCKWVGDILGIQDANLSNAPVLAMRDVRICPDFNKCLMSENAMLAAGAVIKKGTTATGEPFVRIIHNGRDVMKPKYEPESNLFYVTLKVFDPTQGARVKPENFKGPYCRV